MADVYTFGWDASDYDWDRGLTDNEVKQAALDGIGFFTHKITEGTSVVHRNAGRFLRAAQSAGGNKYVGFYVVPRTGNIEQQVAHALAEADRQYPEWRTHTRFFWQVDLEHWGYDNVAPSYGIEMANRLAATGKKVTLYAPKWAYGDTIPSNPYPLWSSNYGSNNADHWWTLWDQRKAGMAGFAPYSGKVPLIWQFGSKAHIGGQSTCDINVFKGSMEDFGKQIVGYNPPVTVPPVSPPTTPEVDMADRYWTGGNIPKGNGKKDAIMVSIPPVNVGGWPKNAALMVYSDFEDPAVAEGVKVRVAFGKGGDAGYFAVHVLKAKSVGATQNRISIPEGTEKISICRDDGQSEINQSCALGFRIDSWN